LEAETLPIMLATPRHGTKQEANCTDMLDACLILSKKQQIKIV
jgi:hypothetical protein